MDLQQFTMHLIGFPSRKQHRLAIMTLLETPRGEYLGLPEYQMVVTNEHIKALEQAGVAFQYLSATAPNGVHASKVAGIDCAKD